MDNPKHSSKPAKDLFWDEHEELLWALSVASLTGQTTPAHSRDLLSRWTPDQDSPSTTPNFLDWLIAQSFPASPSSSPRSANRRLPKATA